MKTYDYDETLAILKDIVQGHEDYVYEIPDGAGHCVYSVDSEGSAPSCIVGHFLYRLDPDVLPKVAAWERDKGRDDYSAMELLTDTDMFGSTFTGKAVNLLEQAQNFQDSRMPWGEAVDMAVRSTR